MTAIDPRDLVRRYVAVWHEPDAELRRKAVHDLWAEDGTHVLQPPEEMRQAAAGLGFPSLILQARGHEELEARVTRTYHEFIASGEYTFRPRDNADRLGDVVKFNWEMIPANGGEVAGVGLEVLVLDKDGRITTDYQFIEGRQGKAADSRSFSDSRASGCGEQPPTGVSHQREAGQIPGRPNDLSVFNNGGGGLRRRPRSSAGSSCYDAMPAEP